ncbi:hypothetical protein ACFLYO_07430 [Chloroflexota bacterium]
MLTRTVHWLPRILAIVFSGFLAIFALDVFSEGYSFGETLVALFMHLIPSLMVLVVLGIAWKWPLVGGVLFLALGIFSVFFFNTYQDLITFLLISLPVFVVGLLFLLDAWYSKRGPSSQI